MNTLHRCACGWRASDIALMRNAHYAWHAQWANGVFVVSAARQTLAAQGWRVTLPRILPVDPRSPAPLRHIAHRAARLFQRENGYDFAMFSQYPKDSHRPTAYLWIEGGRAIGIAVLAESDDGWGWFDERDAEGRGHRTYVDRRPMVAGIWVASAHRRQGIAKHLIERAADLERLPVDELIWGVPFSESGLALARSLVGSEHIRVG
jgi:GNAT superfamily N-acetyltransferase